MSNNMNISKRDVVTMVTVAVALALVVIVFVKIYTGNNEILDSDAQNTTVHLYSETREDGSIEFYTMIEEYTNSGEHASVSYRPRTTKEPSTTKGESTTTKPVTSVVAVTDENGEAVTDENGNPVTQVVTVTQTTTKPSTTSVIAVTDENGEAVTDENGNPVTRVVTEAVETTTRDIWSHESTTNRLGIELEYSNESATASTLVSEINKKRAENGLSALENNGALATAARTNSMARAIPDSFGSSGANLGKSTYTFETSGAGATIYNNILSSASEVVESGAYSRIGIGVIKYEGMYYTTVILI